MVNLLIFTWIIQTIGTVMYVLIVWRLASGTDPGLPQSLMTGSLAYGGLDRGSCKTYIQVTVLNLLFARIVTVVLTLFLTQL